MPTPFDDITLQEALGYVEVPAWYKLNKAFYDGDHWQAGDGWIGPRPSAGSDGYNETLAEIKRAFISANKIKEVVERHTAGVIGRQPAWSFTVRRPLAEGEQPSGGEQALIDEAEALLQEWWDERDAHEAIQEAANTLMWGERSVLRLYVPAGELTDAGTIEVQPAEQSIWRIWLEDLLPDQASVSEDVRTKREVGVYAYKEGDADRVEVTHLDEAGMRTLIRILSRDDRERGETFGPFDFGGYLTMHELERQLFITEQVRQQQRLVNLAKTMLGRNTNLAGFLERVLLNAQLPGHYEEDAAGRRRFVPDSLNVGAGSLNAFVGIKYTDAEGNEQLATPNMLWKDPVPTDLAGGGTERNAYRTILEECDQLHTLIASDATASGESRRQARSDFEKSLLVTAARVERATRWLLETVLAMTAQFAGEPGRYAGLRATVSCRIDTGPLTVEEMRLNTEMADRELLSRRTAMSRNGVEDVDAELALIAQEREEASEFDTERLRRLTETRDAIESDDEGEGGEV